MTINFTTTDTTFTLIIDGVTENTWNKLDEIDSKFEVVPGDNEAIVTLFNPYSSNILTDQDSISVDGNELEGTFREKIEHLKDNVFYLAPDGSGGASTLQATLDIGNTSTTDLEFTDDAVGVILKSPDGTRFRVTVNDAGALVTTEL